MTSDAKLYAIVLTFFSENIVLPCRRVISASRGCFQFPGLSVATGIRLTGVDCFAAAAGGREDGIVAYCRGDAPTRDTHPLSLIQNSPS